MTFGPLINSTELLKMQKEEKRKIIKICKPNRCLCAATLKYWKPERKERDFLNQSYVCISNKKHFFQVSVSIWIEEAKLKSKRGTRAVPCYQIK